MLGRQTSFPKSESDQIKKTVAPDTVQVETTAPRCDFQDEATAKLKNLDHQTRPQMLDVADEWSCVHLPCAHDGASDRYS